MDKPTEHAPQQPQIRKALIAAGELVLVMRCVRADMTSYNGFRWPEHGEVSAPGRGTHGSKSEWQPTKECGNGLHGWLWGAGNLTGTCDYWNADGVRWLVVEVEKKDLIDLDGKVKFPRGVVVFSGDREKAAALVGEHAPAGTPVIFGTATAGDGGTATAGDGGTATAGDGGTATAGYGGTATAGDGGTVAIEWYDAKRGRYRRVIAEIDSDGEYRPGVLYHVVDGRIVAKGPANP